MSVSQHNRGTAHGAGRQHEPFAAFHCAGTAAAAGTCCAAAVPPAAAAPGPKASSVRLASPSRSQKVHTAARSVRMSTAAKLSTSADPSTASTRVTASGRSCSKWTTEGWRLQEEGRGMGVTAGAARDARAALPRALGSTVVRRVCARQACHAPLGPPLVHCRPWKPPLVWHNSHGQCCRNGPRNGQREGGIGRPLLAAAAVAGAAQLLSRWGDLCRARICTSKPCRAHSQGEGLQGVLYARLYAVCLHARYCRRLQGLLLR